MPLPPDSFYVCLFVLLYFSLELIDVFKNHVRSSFYDARDAHDCIFDENCPVEIALAYLNKAISGHCSCDSLYYAQYGSLGRDEYEDFSHQFDVFANEFMTNVRTNHSHQWTDIEFQKLKEIYDNSVFSS